MALRVGEMMVVIRAQDFASRTLRRVGSEFAGMSRDQQLMMRRQQTMVRRMQQADRARKIMESGRGLQLLRQRAEIQERLNQAEQTSMLGRGFRSKAQEIQTLTNALGGADAAINRMGPDWIRLNRQFQTFGAQSLPMLDRRLASNARLLDVVRAGIGPLRQQLDALDEMIRQLPMERLDRVGHAMSGIGRTMQLWGAVGTGAFGLAAHTAADFNTQISLAATQARDLGAGAAQVQLRIDQLSEGMNANGQEVDGVLDLMGRYPAVARDMTDATYEIFSSMQLERNGAIQVAKGLGLLEDANQIAVAGGVDLAEATSAMITVLNNFDPHLQNTTEQFDTMFDIVRFGRMRMSDFNIMMNKIAPAAADAGLSLESVGGAMAYLTTVMPSQRMVATGISRLIEALRHPDVVTGLKLFGVNVRRATGELRPFDEVMRDIAERFPQLRTGQMTAAEFFREISAAGRGGDSRGVIFTQEGRRALSQIMSHLDEYLLRQQQIERNTGEFGRAFEAQARTLGVQWDIFMNRIRALVITIGTDAIPIFVQLGDVIQKFLNFWERLDPATRELIVSIGVFSSVGSLLAGVFLAVVGALASFESMLRRVSFGAAGASGTLGAVGMILRRIAAIGLITIAIKVMVDGPPGWQDLAAGGVLGAILGKRFGRMAMLRGAIVIPVTLAIVGGSLDDVTRRLDEWLVGRGQDLQDESFLGIRWGKTIGNAMEWLGRADSAMQGFNDTQEKTRKGSNLSAAEIRRGERIMDGWRRGVAAATREEKNQANSLDVYRKKLKAFNQDMGEFKQKMRDYKEATERWSEGLADATRTAGTQAVDNLRNMYMQLEQANRQAFGELFQGPWLTSETFDIAREWGIVPRIQDMIRDLREQNNEFTEWRRNIDALMKRGLPEEFINELREQGMESAPLIEQILAAKPGQVQNLIAQWKRRETQIKQQTRMDFVDEINRFKRAGVNMGEAIINGFQQAQVGAWFDGWIRQTFPGVINSAVNQAVAQWQAANPRPVRPTRPTAPTPPGATRQNPAGTATVWNPANMQVTRGIHEIPPTKTNEFNFHVSPFVQATQYEAALRQAAFAARNALNRIG